MKSAHVIGACAVALFLATSAHAVDENWPQFRGSNGSGISASKNPPLKIDTESALRWKVEVPPGASSPCVWGDRIFLTAYADGKLWTLAYSRDTGKELWRTAAPAKQIEKYHHSEGSPAASTCVADGQRVITYFGSCGLLAYDFDGKPLWTYELPMAETSFDFGSGTSPILAQDMVVLVRDVKNGPVAIAVDAATGKERWKADRTGSPTAYSTPTVYGEGKDALLIVPGSLRMKAYELTTGKERWVLRGLPAANCTVAVVGGDRLFFAGWSPGQDDFKMPTLEELLSQMDANKDGKLQKAETKDTPLENFFDNNDTDHDGSITKAEWDGNLAFMKQGKNSLMAINPSGQGDISESGVVWKRSKGLPYVPSPIFYEGRIFFVRDGGFASSYDAATGKPIYEGKRIGIADKYYASPIAAAGHIYLASLDQGTISILRADAEKPEVVAERKLEERISATPALVGDQLYVRSEKHLYCFGEPK